MGKTVKFEVSEDQYDRLTSVKERRGYTWKGLMLEGTDALEPEESE